MTMELVENQVLKYRVVSEPAITLKQKMLGERLHESGRIQSDALSINEKMREGAIQIHVIFTVLIDRMLAAYRLYRDIGRVLNYVIWVKDLMQITENNVVGQAFSCTGTVHDESAVKD
jgi:hypothetical protein